MNNRIDAIYARQSVDKKDSILSGVGGQGILSIATVIGAAAQIGRAHV